MNPARLAFKRFSLDLLDRITDPEELRPCYAFIPNSDTRVRPGCFIQRWHDAQRQDTGLDGGSHARLCGLTICEPISLPALRAFIEGL